MKALSAGGVAIEFTGFLRIFRSLPSLDGILLNPATAPIPGEPAGALRPRDRAHPPHDQSRTPPSASVPTGCPGIRP
jgi:hypothetical protein